MNMERVWEFTAGRILVTLDLVPEQGYEYDGDDPKGETQAKLDAGEYVAFGSVVTVHCDGEEIAQESLWGSVYSIGNVSDFWTAHRTSAPEYRNTLAQKAAGRVICHYFPGMISEAVTRARIILNTRRNAA